MLEQASEVSLFKKIGKLVRQHSEVRLVCAHKSYSERTRLINHFQHDKSLTVSIDKKDPFLVKIKTGWQKTEVRPVTARTKGSVTSRCPKKSGFSGKQLIPHFQKFQLGELLSQTVDSETQRVRKTITRRKRKVAEPQLDLSKCIAQLNEIQKQQRHEAKVNEVIRVNRMHCLKHSTPRKQIRPEPHQADKARERKGRTAQLLSQKSLFFKLEDVVMIHEQAELQSLLRQLQKISVFQFRLPQPDQDDFDFTETECKLIAINLHSFAFLQLSGVSGTKTGLQLSLEGCRFPLDLRRLLARLRGEEEQSVLVLVYKPEVRIAIYQLVLVNCGLEEVRKKQDTSFLEFALKLLNSYFVHFFIQEVKYVYDFQKEEATAKPITKLFNKDQDRCKTIAFRGSDNVTVRVGVKYLIWGTFPGILPTWRLPDMK